MRKKITWIHIIDAEREKQIKMEHCDVVVIIDPDQDQDKDPEIRITVMISQKMDPVLDMENVKMKDRTKNKLTL